jgi:hypothetical protein
VQARFASAVEKMNREFKKEIASKFLITLGDEFQGLLLSPAESYRLVRRFQDLMEPVSFSFGIGVGTLSTPLKNDALGMDGEAFHRARMALADAKKRRRRVLYRFDSPALVRLTPRQKQILELMNALGSQVAVAKRLRISQPAVFKVASSLWSVGEAEDALHDFLERLP